MEQHERRHGGGLATARRDARIVAALIVLVASFSACAAEPREERIRSPQADALGPQLRANGPFLGIDDWVMIVQVASIIIPLVLLVFFIRATRRRRRRHPVLPTFLALVAVCLLDPWANWASYIAFNPEMWHPPTSWPYVSLAPTVEPWVNFLGYPYFFLFPGLVAAWLARRPRIAGARPESFVQRHPLWTLFLGGVILGAVWDAAFEMFLTRSEIYVYSQVVGALSVRAGSTWQFPMVYEVAAMSIVMGFAAVLLWEDDAQRTVCDRVAARWRPLRARPALGAFLVAIAILGASLVAVEGAMWGIRASKAARTVATPWPYLDTKVYDPQGFYRTAGVPGPYFEGVWAGWPSGN